VITPAAAISWDAMNHFTAPTIPFASSLIEIRHTFAGDRGSCPSLTRYSVFPDEAVASLVE